MCGKFRWTMMMAQYSIVSVRTFCEWQKFCVSAKESIANCWKEVLLNFWKWINYCYKKIQLQWICIGLSSLCQRLLYLWPDFSCQNLPHMHVMSKNGFHCQLTALSIKLTNYHNKILTGTCSAFSEACFWSLLYVHECSVSIEYHWLACTGSHFAGNRQPVC